MDSTPVYNLAGRVSATQRSKPTHSAHPTNSMLVSAVKQSRLLSGSGTVQCTHPVFSMMVQILPANLFRSALPTAASLPCPLLPLCPPHCCLSACAVHMVCVGMACVHGVRQIGGNNPLLKFASVCMCLACAVCAPTPRRVACGVCTRSVDR